MGWGGQEIRTLAELTGFQARGSEVSLLAPEGSGILEHARKAGVPSVAMSMGRVHLPWGAIRLATWLRRKRIEILNAHSSRDGWMAGIAGRLARTPFIIRTRHIDVAYPNPWVSRQVFVTLADHVLTTSDRITRHLQETLRIPDGRISTVPTGVDLDVFNPEGERASLPPENADPSLPIIGMVSVLRLAKGHDTFLAAARLLEDSGFRARYVIVGDGPGKERIANRIAELKLGHAVTMTGHRVDVPAVLRSLGALVLASIREGIPQVGLQALATRLPVVGSNVGGILEIIHHGETGRIFPVGDASALAASIRETLTDRAATEAMTLRGREMVERRHSLGAMLDRLDALYRQRLGA